MRRRAPRALVGRFRAARSTRRAASSSSRRSCRKSIAPTPSDGIAACDHGFRSLQDVASVRLRRRRRGARRRGRFGAPAALGVLWRAADDNLLFQRTLKESMHELGHAFGLKHCYNARCAMYYSNSIFETDNKMAHFCEMCDRRLAARATNASATPGVGERDRFLAAVRRVHAQAAAGASPAPSPRTPRRSRRVQNAVAAARKHRQRRSHCAPIVSGVVE